MPHPLDNPIWTALNSGGATHAFGRGDALFIDRKMGFFAGLLRYDVDQLDHLYAEMDPGMRVILFTPGFLELDAKWKVRNDNALLQMVFEKPTNPLNLDSAIRSLGAADVPEMLVLTHLAKPGPFFGKYDRLWRLFRPFCRREIGFHGRNPPSSRPLH